MIPALLDTHTFLWFVDDDPRLSLGARTWIEDPDIDLFLSVVSHWETSIKVGIGKLKLSQPVTTFFPEQMRLNNIALLPISLHHATRVAALPLHHRDPFDRMLVSQCLAEGMPLISADATLDAYGIRRLW